MAFRNPARSYVCPRARSQRHGVKGPRQRSDAACVGTPGSVSERRKETWNPPVKEAYIHIQEIIDTLRATKGGNIRGVQHAVQMGDNPQG